MKEVKILSGRMIGEKWRDFERTVARYVNDGWTVIGFAVWFVLYFINKPLGRLEKHIDLHRFLLGLEQQREIPYEEAVVNWYDEVYLVVTAAVREQNILKEFPGRTETDLYLWLSGYRAFLEEELEWQFEPVAAESRVSPQADTRFQRSMSRIISKLFDKPSFGEAEAGPLPGEWRWEQLLYILTGQTERPFRLFTSILVPVDGQEKGCFALNQAPGVARREGGRLFDSRSADSISREGPAATVP